MTEPPPPWKFWHPMPLWNVVAILFVAQLVSAFIVVGLREGVGIPVPEWVIGGLGGLVGVLAIQARARKLLRS